MIAVIWMLITFKPIMEYNGLVYFLLLMLLMSFFIILMLVPIKDLFGKIFLSIPIFIGISPIIFPALINNILDIRVFLIGLVCIGIILLFVKIMPKRTAYGNEMLGKIRGFKRFLETAEKQQLEDLVSKNPEYFYNILPYTYALGVSKVWVKQFETIAMKEPDWYDSPNSFDMYVFSDFMNSTMSSVSSAMSSSPSSDGSSGGGSSGGGSGRRRRWLLVINIMVLIKE